KDGLNPLILGFLGGSIGMSFGPTTGYAINPARDLGPRLAYFLLPVPNKSGADWRYAWIPIVGPIIGGLLAIGLFN
ncbi:aquaporin, partial [Listeria monocytogenes]|nr:aquaporin [Listeria monocytogenes]